MLDLRGKKILITHTLISEYMGSTIVCAQVAKACQEAGADVLVISGAFTHPACLLFEGIQVVVESDELELDLCDFDYVWIHSQLMPVCCVEQVQEASDASEKALPAFIFNHMSAIDTAPDEHPYIPLLEETLASTSLFVSEESYDKLSGMFRDRRESDRKETIFPNPASAEFSSRSSNRREELGRCAVISNHVPQEVAEAVMLLEQAGIEVEIIGVTGRQVDVNSELLSSFDAVVTIGKTVQYCLVSATPVFVYDYFGGFGYLDDENFGTAAYANFSGRGGKKMSANEIAQKLVGGWQNARKWHDKHRETFRKRYDIGNMLADVFAQVRPREAIETPYEGYWEQISCQMRFAWRYYRAWDYEIWQRNDRASLEKEIAKCNERLSEKQEIVDNCIRQNAALEEKISALDDDNALLQKNLSDSEQALGKAIRELSDVYSSWSFRIGFKLMSPLRWLKGKVQRETREDE